MNGVTSPCHPHCAPGRAYSPVSVRRFLKRLNGPGAGRGGAVRACRRGWVRGCQGRCLKLRRASSKPAHRGTLCDARQEMTAGAEQGGPHGFGVAADCSLMRHSTWAIRSADGWAGKRDLAPNHARSGTVLPTLRKDLLRRSLIDARYTLSGRPACGGRRLDSGVVARRPRAGRTGARPVATSRLPPHISWSGRPVALSPARRLARGTGDAGSLSRRHHHRPSRYCPTPGARHRAREPRRACNPN